MCGNEFCFPIPSQSVTTYPLLSLNSFVLSFYFHFLPFPYVPSHSLPFPFIFRQKNKLISVQIKAGPSTATAGPEKTSRGPIPHSVCLEIWGRKRGERCPLTIRRGVRGSVVSSPAGSWAKPRPKMDFMHILGRKEAIWNTIFSIFEWRRGSPKVAGPGKTSPLSPFRRAWIKVNLFRTTTVTRTCLA